MVTAARLRRSADIARVRSEGRAHGDDTFGAWAWASAAGALRLAVSTQRSIGGAVARNRARRRLREAVRVELRGHASMPALDLVFVARPGLARASAAVVRAGVAREIDRLESRFHEARGGGRA